MTILWVREQPGGRQASFNNDGLFEYTRVFLARVSSIKISSITVCTDPALPKLFDAFVDADTSSDSMALTQNIRAEQNGENPFLWTITVKYSSDAGAQDLGKRFPLLRPAKYSWEPTPYQRICEIDQNGKPLRNTAGDAWQPAVEIDDDRLTLTVTRNEQGITPSFLARYNNVLNSDSFFGFSPLQCKLNTRANDFWEGGQRYYEVTYRIECKFASDPAIFDGITMVGNGGVALEPSDVSYFDTWNRCLLNSGFHKLVPIPILGGQTRVTITDQNGQPYQEPQLLAGDGTLLPTGDGPCYVMTPVYRKTAFNVLQLEQLS